MKEIFGCEFQAGRESQGVFDQSDNWVDELEDVGKMLAETLKNSECEEKYFDDQYTKTYVLARGKYEIIVVLDGEVTNDGGDLIREWSVQLKIGGVSMGVAQKPPYGEMFKAFLGIEE